MLVMLFASCKDRVGDIRDYHHGLFSLVDLLYIVRSAYEVTTYMWSRDVVFVRWIHRTNLSFVIRSAPAGQIDDIKLIGLTVHRIVQMVIVLIRSLSIG